MSEIKHASQATHSQDDWNELPFISHEWEELVDRLSSSQDPRLREIGMLEREFLKLRKSPCGAA